MDGRYHYLHGEKLQSDVLISSGGLICLSPDQSLLYITGDDGRIDCVQLRDEPPLFQYGQPFYLTENPYGLTYPVKTNAMCVDTNGWLYVATSLGIQVCDQAGRVNFIIPTPHEPKDLCFGGKDLSELFVACWDKRFKTHTYKRPTKAKGVVSGQQPPHQARAAEALSSSGNLARVERGLRGQDCPHYCKPALLAEGSSALHTRRMSDHAHLRTLLQRRLDLIADHAFRDRDAETHLEALKNVSEEIMTEHQRLRAQLPPRLNHFLTQASFSKALEYLDSSED